MQRNPCGVMRMLVGHVIWIVIASQEAALQDAVNAEVIRVVLV